MEVLVFASDIVKEEQSSPVVKGQGSKNLSNVQRIARKALLSFLANCVNIGLFNET